LQCFEECDLCLQQLLLIAPPGSAPAAAAKVERQALRQAKEKYRQSSKVMAKNIAKKLFVDRKETTGSVSSTTSMEVEPTVTGSIPEEEEEQKLVSRTEETAGSAVTEDFVSQKGTYSSSSLAEDSKNAVAPPNSFSPVEHQQSVAPSSKGPAADLGLLLLLATSLLVLAVSVGLVLWANIIAPEEQQFIPVRSEDLSAF
jgi:hypothetical protein